jgi:hypothetical protein
MEIGITEEVSNNSYTQSFYESIRPDRVVEKVQTKIKDFFGWAGGQTCNVAKHLWSEHKQEMLCLSTIALTYLFAKKGYLDKIPSYFQSGSKAPKAEQAIKACASKVDPSVTIQELFATTTNLLGVTYQVIASRKEDIKIIRDVTIITALMPKVIADTIKTALSPAIFIASKVAQATKRVCKFVFIDHPYISSAAIGLSLYALNQKGYLPTRKTFHEFKENVKAARWAYEYNNWAQKQIAWMKSVFAEANKTEDSWNPFKI